MYRSSIPSEEINQMPMRAFEGNIIIVDSLDKVLHAVQSLTACSVVGFDTETKPSFTRGEHHNVALLQLSTTDEAFLIRLDKIGLPEELLPILENPFKLKIGAAVADDIRGLQRHRKFKAGGFVDLQNMMSHYGIQDKALKKMAALTLGVQISKSQQTSNWEADPYSPEQMLYAATDASICRDIFMELILNGTQIEIERPAPSLNREPNTLDNASEGMKKTGRNRRYKHRKKPGQTNENPESNS